MPPLPPLPPSAPLVPLCRPRPLCRRGAAALLETSLSSTLSATGSASSAPTPAAASHTRPASRDPPGTTAQALYSKLFDWVVEMINSSLISGEGGRYFIGAVDIFGFECSPRQQRARATCEQSVASHTARVHQVLPDKLARAALHQLCQ